MSRGPCGVAIAASNVFCHLKPASSGHDDSCVAGLHRLRGQQAGRQEGEVGHAAEGRGRAATKRAQADAHRGQEQDRRDERSRKRAAPDAPVDDQAGACSGRESPRDWPMARFRPTRSAYGRSGAGRRPPGCCAERALVSGRSPRACDRRGRLLAIGGVDQHAVGQLLDALADAVELAVERVLHADREAQLEHLARRRTARSAGAANPRPRSWPCPSPPAGRTAARPRPCSAWSGRASCPAASAGTGGPRRGGAPAGRGRSLARRAAAGPAR